MKSKQLARGAIIAALYVSLTYLQNLILPGSTSWAIQFRVSEALCVLSFFTPAAIPGLTLGCFLYNVSFAGALPLDMVMGTAATLLATAGMYSTRNIKLCKLPILGLLLPAVANAILVGWELSIYVGGSFLLNAFYVALGELGVLFTLGIFLYMVLRRRNVSLG